MTINKANKLLRVFFLKQRRLPTYEEMMHLCGYHSKFSCVRLVKKLIAADMIMKDSEGKLLPKNLFAIPHVSLLAGETAKQVSVATDSFNMYDFMLQFPTDSFSLTVQDDAMIGEGIFPGDMVIIDCDRQITHGTIIAVHIADTWLVRYYLKQQNAIVLTAANDEYLPLYPKKNLAIGGAVVHVIRHYK